MKPALTRSDKYATTADTVVVFLWNDSSPFSSRLSGRRVSPRQLMDGQSVSPAFLGDVQWSDHDPRHNRVTRFRGLGDLLDREDVIRFAPGALGQRVSRKFRIGNTRRLKWDSVHCMTAS